MNDQDNVTNCGVRAPKSEPLSAYKVGDKVECLLGTEWRSGDVVSVTQFADCVEVNVQVSDTRTRRVSEPDEIRRPPRYKVGDKVQCITSKGWLDCSIDHVPGPDRPPIQRYYRGQITGDTLSGQRVLAFEHELRPRPPKFLVGQEVHVAGLGRLCGRVLATSYKDRYLVEINGIRYSCSESELSEYVDAEALAADLTKERDGLRKAVESLMGKLREKTSQCALRENDAKELEKRVIDLRETVRDLNNARVASNVQHAERKQQLIAERDEARRVLVEQVAGHVEQPAVSLVTYEDVLRSNVNLTRTLVEKQKFISEQADKIDAARLALDVASAALPVSNVQHAERKQQLIAERDEARRVLVEQVAGHVEQPAVSSSPTRTSCAAMST